MKLATIDNGTRDGRLLLVSADLARCAEAPWPTLQAALDDWERAEPELRAASRALDGGGGQPFDPVRARAPLPRAYAWYDGSAYLAHMARVRRARGAEMPASFATDPLMYQGGSDVLLGAHDAIRAADEAWGIDFEAEVGVITGDVPMGVSPADAARHIRLIVILNDVSLRNLIPGELAKGFGFFQSKPPTAFAPCAVTPDACPGWDGAKLNLPMRVWLNGEPFGAPLAGQDLSFDFPRLIAHAAMTRPLTAGTIIGSGTVSNEDESVGGSCLQEARVIETIRDGTPQTPFMRFGDRVRIDVLDDAGQSVFGAIDQRVERCDGAMA